MLITEEEKAKVGHALSTLIQQRYVWLFSHISRATFLHVIDNSLVEPPKNYFFSLEDLNKGAKPIEAHFIIDLLRKKDGKPFAYSKDPNNPSVYDFQYVREITLTGIRGSFLIAVQSYLEYYTILKTFNHYTLPERELFDFIRQARNIVCHSNGLMSSPKLKRCQWRNKIIERNNAELKISDQDLLALIEDAIVALAKLYINNNGDIDYVSLNLGYSIPFIRNYISEHKK